jgi:hypothetical protein
MQSKKLRTDQICWQFWRWVCRNRFMSFCIRFEKSHKNLLRGSLTKVTQRKILGIYSGNRTLYILTVPNTENFM